MKQGTALVWSYDGVEIHTGDCLDVLPTLEAGSVHCCVTSPPYWGLRDYGTATWEGGDEGCDHKKSGRTQNMDKLGDRLGCGGGHSVSDNILEPYLGTCGKCGANRVDSQLGLEATPEEYVEKMVAVFREVWRVLRDDGTCWINMGDGYTSGNRDGHGTRLGNKQETNRGNHDYRPPTPNGLKPKDLVGMPWRVAFALQADGWYLRSDIIWHKPNPMPESVTDRPTKSHEYIFLLSKSQRYYYDAGAIEESCSLNTHARISQDLANQIGSERAHAGGKKNGKMKAVIKGSTRKLAESGSGIKANESFENAICLQVTKRNKRSVWTIPSFSYKGAHFATFPPKLIEPCILAGCPEGGTVLDPFLGSGTTVMVARESGRKAVGIELNPEYVEMATKRFEQLQLFGVGAETT